MSGRKQHFIPQSLIRGFSIQGAGKKAMVIAYTHERGVFTAATDGVGAERNFYSELGVDGDEPTLDDRITAYESPLADTLMALRMIPNGKIVDCRGAAELVTHLVVRNDHFRKSMASAGGALFDGISNLLEDEGTSKQLLGLAGETPSAMLEAEMDKAFDEHWDLLALAGLTREQFKTFGFAKIKDEFSSFQAELIAPAAQMFRSLSSDVDEVAANAQRKSMGKSGMAPSQRVERLIRYEWRVIHKAERLILPDCVAIVVHRDGSVAPVMLGDLDETASVVMPLSSDRLLVGSMKDAGALPADLNEACAACSWDFFVGAECSDRLQTLRSTLRSRSQGILDQTIDEAMARAGTSQDEPIL